MESFIKGSPGIPDCQNVENAIIMTEKDMFLNEITQEQNEESKEETYDIRVVDAICGSGKTTAAIEYMKRETDKQFIYVTPFLSEIDRVKKECSSRRFYDPQIWGTKMDSFLKLIGNGGNIATTHSLFKNLSEQAKDLIEAHDYVLIMDEVMTVVDFVDISRKDLKIILDKNNKLAHIDEDYYLIWDDHSYKGKYEEIKQMCENKNVIVVNNVALLWNFPINIFKCFKEVWILTYMFEGQVQKSYFDFHNVSYKYYGVNNNMDRFIVGKHQSKIKYGNLIDIYTGQLNNIGKEPYTLSRSWFDNENNKILIEVLKKNIYNYFKSGSKTKSKDNMWTTFKGFRQHIKGEGYAKGFVSSNARATNDYRHKKSLAYCLNKFLNPLIYHFFNQKNIKFNQDSYALSELVQWIFRSQLRDKKPIKIYIPSRRMRELLKEWCSKN